MIVILDSTELTSDLGLSAVRWWTLANLPKAVVTSVRVPEVVVAEVVANHRKVIDDAINGIKSHIGKWGRLPGLRELYDNSAALLRAQDDSHEGVLRGLLHELGCTVVGPPQVDHLELARRLIGRNPPCKDNGSGYRDTLNWYTVLATAADTDQTVVWISDDHDFGEPDEDDGTGWHPELIEELAARG